MAVLKSHQGLFVAVVVLQFVGCLSLSRTPDKTIINKFAHIDTLMITADPDPIKITDSATIQQLAQLYEQAKWKPFIDTMPADVVAIQCTQDGKELFRLLFGAGWLIEWEYGKGGIRKSELDASSVEWLYKLIGQHH